MKIGGTLMILDVNRCCYHIVTLVLLLFSSLTHASELVNNIHFYSGVAAKAGYCFFLTGNGFLEGDLIKAESASQGQFHLFNLQIVDENTVKFRYPEGIKTGDYQFTLVRNSQTQDLGTCSFVVMDKMPKGTEVIAHRGYWKKEGASQNSRTSLKYALDLGCYGSETDVWLTSDGYIVCNHDASYNGVTIANSTLEQVQQLVLSNGETMPTLEEFLTMLNEDSPTKLIIELKHYAATDSTLSLVHRMGLEDKVEYISFSLNACKRIAEKDPNARVSYLSGEISPEDLIINGINGLDYTAENYRNNSQWIDEANELGLTTNVWTINDMKEIIEMNNLGIGFITTNYPESAIEIKKYYRLVNEEVNSFVYTQYREQISAVKTYATSIKQSIIQECPDVHSSYVERIEQLIASLDAMLQDLDNKYNAVSLTYEYQVELTPVTAEAAQIMAEALEAQRQYNESKAFIHQVDASYEKYDVFTIEGKKIQYLSKGVLNILRFEKGKTVKIYSR